MINTNENPLDNISASDARDCLSFAVSHGIISESDIQNSIAMRKKEQISQVHNYRIWQGSGKDKRWFTWIPDENYPEGRRKIGKATEKELIDFLYAHYFEEQKSYKKRTLTDIYPEFISYKLKTANRANTVQRMETDFRKFYLNEPLSIPILTKPILELTKAEIKEWYYGLIKKYNLKKCAFYGATTILRQVFDYLIEKEVTERNPCKLVKIPSSAFRKDGKGEAENQIFYRDEIERLLSFCISEAEKKKDIAFLAIPLFFYTGLRIGECLALSFSDCSRQTHTIYVHGMLATVSKRRTDGTWEKRGFEYVDFLKGNGDPREVLVNDKCFDIIDMIKKIQFSSGVVSPYLFPNVSESNVQTKLYRVCDTLGIKRRSPHKLRKTYISSLLNAGADPDFVRNQVGHKEIQTTLNSYTYSTTRKEEQLVQLNRILSV